MTQSKSVETPVCVRATEFIPKELHVPEGARWASHAFHSA